MTDFNNQNVTINNENFQHKELLNSLKLLLDKAEEISSQTDSLILQLDDLYINTVYKTKK